MNGSAGAAHKKDNRTVPGTGVPRGGSADRGALVLPSLGNPQESSSPLRHYSPAGRTVLSSAGARTSSSLGGRESPDGLQSTSDKGVLRTEGSLRSTSSSAPPINNEVLLMSRKRQSLHLMRLVYKEVGEQLPKDQMTCNENLEKMRAEAVVGLLRHKSWWEFFKEASGQKKPSWYRSEPSHGPNTEDCHPDALLGMDAEDTFRRLKKRIVSMWKDLKFPKSDTEYFLCHVMNTCKYTMEQFGDLSAYLNVLEDYRSATVSVLQTIRAREQAVAGLRSLLQTLSPARSSGVDDRAPDDYASNPAPIAPKEIDESIRNDLLTFIQEVQIQTVHCINLISDWRRILWRPLPFCYRGENYLIRIGNSLAELTLPIHCNLLKILDLRPADLLCVTFPSQYVPDQSSSSGSAVERVLGCVPIDALHAADAVVAREPQVQAAFEAERKHLESQGKFIATLRFQLPSESQGSHGTRDGDHISTAASTRNLTTHDSNMHDSGEVHVSERPSGQHLAEASEHAGLPSHEELDQERSDTAHDSDGG